MSPMQILQTLIEDLLANNDVTDVHLCEGDAPRIRVKRDLVLTDHPPIEPAPLAAWLGQQRPGDAKVQAVLTGKVGNANFASAGAHGRLRCNVYAARGTLRLAIRRIYRGDIGFEALGLPASLLDLADQPRGIFLTTGPTGSGKSTTQAALIQHFNLTRQGHILELADPIEYEHVSGQCLITQREIGTDEVSFAAGLHGALREDLNILVVGEMRDRETVELALRAAETGHLVVGTLHTAGAAASIERVASLFDGAERGAVLSVLATTMCGVVSQTLIRGIEGQVALAAEILVPTTSVRANIRNGNIVGIRQDMETGQQDGQITLHRALAALYHARRIEREDALFYATDRDRLERML
ncbi:ATPase, T2SS/T4P/T4SS family [Pandoraea sp.]|uniref:type IV pilus twitching motility protein PilT n=1 Tax=Pandoraea sp. TaxID=1883445 RepID=UPI0011FBB3AA|nr:ATPase, T2SS/T4P/T4SS family [Pandoraea sp.]TAL56922.1 MAG: type IV pili twitching motility protein PilT [Pandoraea sp.]TAM17716.1 MAG: type IV pili twitching motility protein PilT [Pandoraea sp.]